MGHRHKFPDMVTNILPWRMDAQNLGLEHETDAVIIHSFDYYCFQPFSCTPAMCTTIRPVGWGRWTRSGRTQHAPKASREIHKCIQTAATSQPGLKTARNMDWLTVNSSCRFVGVVEFCNFAFSSFCTPPPTPLPPLLKRGGGQNMIVNTLIISNLIFQVSGFLVRNV